MLVLEWMIDILFWISKKEEEEKKKTRKTTQVVSLALKYLFQEMQFCLFSSSKSQLKKKNLDLIWH